MQKIINILVFSLLPTLIMGHGSLEHPKSRVKRVYEALTQSPRPVWAAQAVALDGENAYFTWNQLSRNLPGAISGNSQTYIDNIPDGQLASAGNNPNTSNLSGHPGLSFSGLDTVSSAWDWPATPVTAGVQTFSYHATATHNPSFFKVWITKEGYDVKTPLKWSDLEYLGQPTHSLQGNYYSFDVNLPQRTGRAVVYVAWQRVDPVGEVFFATSDIDFGGGQSGSGGNTGNTLPVVGFTQSAITVTENSGQASVNVTLSSAAPAGGVSVNYTTSAGTADASDFSSTTGTLNFAAGETQKTIVVPIINDAVEETAEVFSLALSNVTGGTLGQASAQITINDDDAPVATNSGYRFVVTQNWGSGWEAKLEIVNGGTAAWSPWSLEFDAPWTIASAYNGDLVSKNGQHYTYGPKAWNSSIGAGQTFVFDWMVNATGGVAPSAPTNVRMNGQLIGQLAPGVGILSQSVDEGDSNRRLNLTLQLESAHTDAISVKWQTISGTATAGQDFTDANGTVTFAVGETTKTVSVELIGDEVEEGLESFTVALSGVDGQALPRFISGQQSATITLRDDDAKPFVWVTGDSVIEGNTGTKPLNFTIWLSRAPKNGEIVEVDYATVNETAVAADADMSTMGISCNCRPNLNTCDYTPVQGKLTFAPGIRSINLAVDVKGDTRDEDLETFQLQLSQFVGCVAKNTFAVGQIVDEDMAGSKLNQQRRVVAYADVTAGAVTLPPADRITHLFAAFANVGTDGNLTSVPDLSGWSTLKNTNPSLKILLSVGGWNWSANFPQVANDTTKRAAFANSCRSVVQSQDLDGIDLDWEWPGGGNAVPLPNDRANFTALVHEVRLALDSLSTQTGKTYELTCYAPASAANLAFWDLPALKNDFDFFNVQGYDLHGPWDSVTGHQSGLKPNPSKNDGLYISEVLKLYTDAGVSRSQLLVGAPFYAYYWNQVNPLQNGFNQSGVGASDVTYRNLTAANGWAKQFIRVWDAYAEVPFLYEPTEQGTGRWVTYDDPQSVFAKARYCRDEGFGGLFFWQLGGDTLDGQLLTAMSDALADPVNLDSDADGLPDSWENAHFGNLNVANASSDYDQDGASDFLEYRTRTHPKSAQDLPFIAVHHHGNEPMVSLPTSSRVQYRVERSLDMKQWSPMNSFTGNGAALMLHDNTLPAQTKKAFYRLVIP